MTYQFARINLAKTTYQPTVDWYYIVDPDVDRLAFIDENGEMYRDDLLRVTFVDEDDYEDED